MTERDQEQDGTSAPNEFVPGEADFDEELDEGQEAEGEPSQDESDESAAIAPAAGSSRRRVGAGRGRDHGSETHVPGSVRTDHDRVHIDDRPSAIFAIVCAFGLVGVLALSFVGAILPKAAVPPLKPLTLQTGNFTLPPATATISIAPGTSATVSAAPTASPVPSPTK